MASPTDETLRRAVASAAHFCVPEEMIAAPAGAVTRIPEAWRHQVGMDALVDAILEIAESHRPCPGSATSARPSGTGSP